MTDRPPLAEQLDLRPHPEGGWYRRTWTSEQPAADRGRQTASAIYYLLGAGEESRWHRVGSDEVWLWHHGGPLDLYLGGTGEKPNGANPHVLLGNNFDLGHQPQIIVPGGTWQTARAGRAACLVTCVVSPEFHFDDFELLG